MATYLVTGGAGFIGSHLATALLADGHRVRILDDLSTGRQENLDVVVAAGGERVEIVRGDVGDRATVRVVVAGVEGVFHEAAMVSVALSVERPERCHRDNVLSTGYLLEEGRAAGVRRLVLASSAAVYGNEPSLPTAEDHACAPVSPYGESKLAAEELCAEAARAHGTGTVCLRYFNVFGPRQRPDSDYAAVVPAFVHAVRSGRRPQVHGDGLQRRDFVHVRDVVQANLRAMLAPEEAWGRAFNVGSGRATNLIDLLRAIGRARGAEVSWDHTPPRAGDVRDSCADIRLAREVLGYRPAVDLETGLAELLA